MLWELEETWSLPTPELIAGIAIFFALSTTTNPHPTPLIELQVTTSTLFLFQTLIIAVLFARSIAGAIEKREILIFFTYPVQRTTVLTSKFLTNLILTFLIFGSTIIAKALLALTEPWNIAVLIALFILFLQTLFLCTLSLMFSLLTKRTWAAMLLVILFFFAAATAFTQLEPPFKYAFPTYAADVISSNLTQGFVTYTVEDFAVALGFPIITSAIFLIVSLIYFKRVQVD
jgi:ABC-type transport system involved in multi-copper enzyme maturation permease subunit